MLENDRSWFYLFDMIHTNNTCCVHDHSVEIDDLASVQNRNFMKLHVCVLCKRIMK